MSLKNELTKVRLESLMRQWEEKNFPQILQELRKAHGLSRRGVCKDLELSEMRMFWLENGYFKKEIHDGEIALFARYYGIDPEKLFKKYINFTDQRKPQTDYVPKRKRKKNEN